MKIIDKDINVGFSIPKDGDIERVAKREVDYKYFSKLRKELKKLIDSEIEKIVKKHCIHIFVDNEIEDNNKVRVKFELDLNTLKN